MKALETTLVRRVAVILLLAAVVASTIVAIMALAPEVKYLIARSLAVDMPLYGSYFKDLEVIRQEYLVYTWGTGKVIAACIQCIAIWGLAFLIVHWDNHREEKAKPKSTSCSNSWDETVKAAEGAEAMRDLRDALDGLNGRGKEG